MSEGYRLLILILGPSLLAGWVIGHFVRRTRPNWCKSYAKFSNRRPWKILLLGFVLFAFLAGASFLNRQIAFAIFFAGFAVFELVALLYFGFRRPSPTQEQAIEKSDPKKGSFQYGYWQLLIAVIIGSLWTWALIDWAILEDQRELAARKERRQTLLRIRDQVAVEACRAFLCDQLPDSKRDKLRLRLEQFRRADPKIAEIKVTGSIQPSPWPTGIVVGSGGACDALWPPGPQTFGSGIVGWRGSYWQDGKTHQCEVLSIPVVVPERPGHKESFRICIVFLLK